MGSDIGKCGICGQILLVIVNILFIVLGIIAIAIGGWAIANGNSFSFLTGNQLIGGSAVLIIVGAAVIVIAAVGMFGAMCKVRVLLIIYAIVVLIIVIAEIVVGAIAVAFRDQVAAGIQGGIEENLIAQYDSTTPDSDANTIVNFFQSTFACCGFNNATDWVNDNLVAITTSGGRPPSCLVCTIGQENCATFEYPVEVLGVNETRTFNTTSVGCASVNTQALLGLAIGAGVVGLVFGFMEIIGIVISLLLCVCIHRAHKQTVV